MGHGAGSPLVIFIDINCLNKMAPKEGKLTVLNVRMTKTCSVSKCKTLSF